ncbi:ribonuclease D [Fastidiosibacter lacustris]|uniref:ribonuclease D n=1 Tax=Fastidiosibacter lacustris TaxID=2056695 RepID=UPI000E3454DF|nr:ribonuclease D [Fastidiosibacter lacustris]
MVTNNNELNCLVKQLLNEPFIALDTEFYWRNTYYPQLCLIQIATPSDIYIIDTLATEMSLDLLTPVLETHEVCKIMHAANNDIKILHHYLNCQVNNIFDTQTAMAFLGHSHQLSLANTLNELGIGILDKQQKTSDWRTRPLSDLQLNYAKEDIAYLIHTHQLLQQRLQALGWLDAFYEEMKVIVNSHFTNAHAAPFKFKNQLMRLNGKAYDNVITLSIWREQYAQNRNWVVRYILSDDELLKIAKLNPVNEQMLINSKILSAKKLHYLGAKIIDLLINNNVASHSFKLKSHPYPMVAKDLLNQCFAYIEQLAKDHQLSLALICSKQELKEFLCDYLHAPLYLRGKLTQSWRYEKFIQPVCKLIDKLRLKSDYKTLN